MTDAGVTYTASVGVGSPATQYTLLIDTGLCPLRAVLSCTSLTSCSAGSSNTWVGADKSYRPTSSSKSTGQSVVSSALLIRHVIP